MSNINAEYKKWYDRFSNQIATKEKHIDVLLEKGVITKEEYDSIINQTGYVERTVEPVRKPSKVDMLEEEVVLLKTETITSGMTDSMLLLQVADLQNEKKEQQEEMEELQATNGMLLLQIAQLLQVPTLE